MADEMLEEFSDGVAVITGGAGSIGLGYARVFSRQGLHVVLSDVDAEALATAAREITDAGGQATTVVADVADPEQVAALCKSVVDRFGPPRVVCSNAGVLGRVAELWAQRPADWKWVLDVNVSGTLGMIQGLIPAMIEGGRRSHFVITGSEATYASRAFASVYHASKHALGAIAEGLAMELGVVEAPIAVHFVCPGGVDSPRLLAQDRERLRPKSLRVAEPAPPSLGERLLDAYRQGTSKQSGDQVAAAMFEGLRRNQFYIFPDPNVLSNTVKNAYEAVAEGRYPALPPGLARLFETPKPESSPGG